ncbi:MAG: fused MFS/spermidine synthase [Patescibacteria group bacterium]
MKNNIFLYIFVFVCGAAVMLLEMAASRLVAPYFGSSIFVWGNIIGVVLAALSLGYYLGGKVADKYPKQEILMLVVLIAGIYISFVPVFFKTIASKFVFTGNLSIDLLWIIIFGSFLMSLIFFAPPIFLLGFVSPYTIRLITKEVKNAGKISGSLYGFSTMGSIVGTFLGSFLTVPFWGSRETIYLSSFLLIFLSVVGLGKKKLYLLLILLLPILLYLYQDNQAIKENDQIIYEDDTMYQYLEISQNGNQKMMKNNEGTAIFSMYDPDNILLNMYYDYFNILPILNNKKQGDALIIGLAGGLISKQYNYFYPDIKLTGVEIDPGVITAANKFFDLEQQNIKVVEADGRVFLKNSNEQYDFIILDAFSQSFYIPWHLTTLEFFQEIDSHLTNNGIVAFNTIGLKGGSSLLTSFNSTLKQVYDYVYIIPDQDRSNNIILAANHELDFSNKTESKELTKLFNYSKNNYWEVKEVDKNKIFTDNRAPVELLTEEMWLKRIFGI